MRRIIMTIAAIITLLCLTACGQTEEVPVEEETAPTWQEQYDLGIRYLSEGKYEEAILAFTAAIQIDAKQPLAFIGRAEAHIASGETTETLASALTDYETAVGLDETNADAWLGMADVYIRQGDSDKAREILEQALEKVGENQAIADLMQTLGSSDESQNGSIGTLQFSGQGNNWSISLTYPALPTEVYTSGDTSGYQGSVMISFSDGKETFAVATDLVLSEEHSAGMVPFLKNPACRSLVMLAEKDDEYSYNWPWLNLPVSFKQDGKTIIWDFQLPPEAFSPQEVQYIGYWVWYRAPEEETISNTATYLVENGQLVYLNDGVVEDLGFLTEDFGTSPYWDYSYQE